MSKLGQIIARYKKYEAITREERLTLLHEGESRRNEFIDVGRGTSKSRRWDASNHTNASGRHAR